MGKPLYIPHKNQELIHRSKARYRVAVCGRRFGKTVLLLNECLARGMQLENQICWIILPTYAQAKEVYWIDADVTKYYAPYIEMGLIERNLSELSLHIKHKNSWIRFKGADNPDGLRGSGIDFIGWDETDDIKHEAFDIIEPALADSPNHRMLYIGTPKGLGKLHDLGLRGDHGRKLDTFGKNVKLEGDWETFHFTSYDNATWPEGSMEREQFVKFLDRKRKEAEDQGKLNWWRQEFMASFEEGAGRFFETWNPRTHVIQPIKIPINSTHIGGIDWGYAAPFVFLQSIVMKIKPDPMKGERFLPFHRVITFREWDGTNITPKKWAGRMKKLPLEKFSYIRSSHDMFSIGRDGSVSIADQMKETLGKYGYVLKKASKNRILRWQAMRQWMSIAPDGLPYWLITQDCPNLIRTIPLQTYDDKNIEDVSRKQHENSHWVEAMGYSLLHLKFIDAYIGASRDTMQVEDRAFVGVLDPKLMERPGDTIRSWKQL